MLHFGANQRQARRKYVDFLEAGLSTSDKVRLSRGGLVRSYGGWEQIGQLRKEHIFCIGDERILGDSHFVERVLEADEIAIEFKSKLNRDGWNLDKLIDHVCEYYGIKQSSLFERSRKNSVSEAKAVICYLGVEKLGLKSREIAIRLRISQPAVSKWISKGREIELGASCPDLFG